MGRTIINETENKQTVILNDSAESVSGGFFDADMEWHTLSSESAFNFTGKEGTLFGEMGKALVSGDFSSGTFTAGLYTNEWQTMLDTGRDNLHGIMMWDNDGLHVLSGSANAQFIIMKKNDNESTMIATINTPTQESTLSDQMGTVVTLMDDTTVIDKRGVEGIYRLNGSLVEYKGRYDKNAKYQSIIPNTTWEWIAW